MKREDFLKQGLRSLGALSLIPALTSCKSEAEAVTPDTSTVVSDPIRIEAVDACRSIATPGPLGAFIRIRRCRLQTRQRIGKFDLTGQARIGFVMR